eukprot:29804_1
MAAQPNNSFFADTSKRSLFARTNRQQTHNGGLPAPGSPSYSSSTDLSTDTIVVHPDGHAPISPPQTPIKVHNKLPPKKQPPKKFNLSNNNHHAPPSLPPRKLSSTMGTKPALPNRSVTALKSKSFSPTPSNAERPKLPPRKKTLPNTNGSRKPPPSKSAIGVAAQVRKASFDPPSKSPATPPAKPPKRSPPKKGSNSLSLLKKK